MRYSSPEDFNRAQAHRLATLVRENKPLAIAVLSVNALRNTRIFTEGKDSAGAPIGSYSTKPMLATKSQFPRESAFKPTVVSNRLVFSSNVKSRKTSVRKSDSQKNNRVLFIKFPNAQKAVPVMVIPGGYKEFRALNGRQNNFVDLTLYGNLRRDNAKLVRINKNTYVAGPVRPENQQKLAGLQNKYNKAIAQHTAYERQELLGIVVEETVKILSGA